MFQCNSALFTYIRAVVSPNSPLSLRATIIVIGTATLLIGALLSGRLYSIPVNYRNYNPNEYEPRWRGIKGAMLVLPCLLAVEFVRFFVWMKCDSILFTQQAWQALATPGSTAYSPWFGPFIHITAIGVCIRFVYLFLLVAAFVRRRRIVRLLAAGYLAFVPLLFLIRDILLTQIFPRGHEVLFENFKQISGVLPFAVIVIPYLFISRRVQATFSN
jgi:hypothetical protein